MRTVGSRLWGSRMWGPRYGAPDVGSQRWAPTASLTPTFTPQPVLVQRGRFGRFLRKIRRFRPKVTITIQGSARFG